MFYSLLKNVEIWWIFFYPFPSPPKSNLNFTVAWLVGVQAIHAMEYLADRSLGFEA